MSYEIEISADQLRLIRRVLRSVSLAPLTAKDICPARPEDFYEAEPVGELSAEEIEEIFLLQGCIESTLDWPEGNGMMHGFCI